MTFQELEKVWVEKIRPQFKDKPNYIIENDMVEWAVNAMIRMEEPENETRNRDGNYG